MSDCTISVWGCQIVRWMCGESSKASFYLHRSDVLKKQQSHTKSLSFFNSIVLVFVCHGRIKECVSPPNLYSVKGNLLHQHLIILQTILLKEMVSPVWYGRTWLMQHLWDEVEDIIFTLVAERERLVETSRVEAVKAAQWHVQHSHTGGKYRCPHTIGHVVLILYHLFSPPISLLVSFIV